MKSTRMLLHLWMALAASTQVPAGPLTAFEWHGADGRGFEGIYLGSAAGKAQFAGPAGVRLAVDVAQLAAGEPARLAELDHSGAAALAASSVAPFRLAPSPARNKLPRLNQGEFGSVSNNCFPNALAAFLLWWDEQGVLAVPVPGDAHTKAVWLHERLNDYCATTEAEGTATRNGLRGVRSYFQHHLAEVAALRVGTDFDCTPANLARYPVGLAACLLNVTVYHGDTRQGCHFVALLAAGPDGTLRFRSWGQDCQGKLRVLEETPTPAAHGPRGIPATRREIDLTHTSDLPAWFRQLKVRFVIDPAEWNGLIIAVPYIYQKKPGRAAPPPDPLFEGLDS